MIQPILNTLLIKPLPSEGVSAGGIYVPESYSARNQKAIVIISGSKSKFKPGQEVWNIKDAGDELLIDGEKHFLIKDFHVLAYETN